MNFEKGMPDILELVKSRRPMAARPGRGAVLAARSLRLQTPRECGGRWGPAPVTHPRAGGPDRMHETLTGFSG